MRVQLAGVGKHFGAHVILDQVTLTIGPKARIGLVGPNGVGKTTLLRIVAGQEQPDAGTVARAPSRLTVGYLEQERTAQPGVSVLDSLARAHGYRECRTGARSIRARSGRRAACRGSLRGRPRSSRFARRRELRAASSRDVRRPRARCRSRPRARRALGRRVRARRPRRDPALALRRAAPRRADERPRLRRAGAARAVSRRISRRSRRRLARPRVPRPDGRSHRLDRAGHAARAGVGGRLERLRDGTRHRTRCRAGGVRAGAASTQAADDAPEHATDRGALEGRLARRQDGRPGPPRDACARDEGAAGRAAPRTQRAARQALPAMGAEADARRGTAPVRSGAPALGRCRAPRSLPSRAGRPRPRAGRAAVDRRSERHRQVDAAWECSSATCRSPKANAWSGDAP